MKKKWENPQIVSLSSKNTEEVGAPQIVNPDHTGKVKCGICNKVFNNLVDYHRHQTQQQGTLGWECPSAPDNGEYEEWIIPLS